MNLNGNYACLQVWFDYRNKTDSIKMKNIYFVILKDGFDIILVVIITVDMY